ncbi:acyltransferase family protein [Actinokineospora sp. HUAS TT18]|uniref:acyltransferase family protein n=1 Tax=Actinokineospora sp. HUAS TT18 TaxID=3447451 RepID=UPI003F528786
MSWDVIRVLAVYSVVVQHVTHQSPINHPELGPYPFVLTLQFGASTLMVISAYFVCVTVRRGDTGWWLRNRLARLLPAYLLAVVLTYFVTRAVAEKFGWYVPDVTDLVANLLLIQAWSPEFHWIDASYWTFPLQVMAFIAAALLWPSRWRRGKALTGLLWALILIPLVLRVFRGDDAPQWFKSVFDGLALHRVALFGVGVAIWLWTQNRMSARHLGFYVTAALVAQDAHSYFADTWSTIAFGVIIIGIIAAAGGPDWDIPGLRDLARPIRWLGGISFGVYLVHQELGFVLARFLLDAGVGPWGRLAACVAMAVLLGWAMTKFVERPAHRLLTGQVWHRAKVAAVAVAAAVRDLPQVPSQPQAPSSGGVPPRSGRPRPVNHVSAAAADPLSSVSWAPMANSQLR